jgi:hypothetical protein
VPFWPVGNTLKLFQSAVHHTVIHKLQIHMPSSFNRANRHSMEVKALAALKGDLVVKRR